MIQSLHIEDWAGWSSSAAHQPANPAHNLDARIETPALPAMLRRRLDKAGRAACEILALLDIQSDCPLVYASRHGDVTASLDMLSALADDEALSPARFSMSVHNAVMGVYSIARQRRAPIQALGACGDEFEALLWEAQGYLASGHDNVVVVLSEGDMPQAYSAGTEHPEAACVVGLRLGATRGRRLHSTPRKDAFRPTPLDIMAWLESPESILAARQSWHLEHS